MKNLENFSFTNLFIFDLANNHQGDIEHASRIINDIGSLSSEENIRGVLKFQFRELDSFIHPNYKDRVDLKFIKRFNETKLRKEDFEQLVSVARSKGLLVASTPFDEKSVDWFYDLDLDILKVASCSADDWPLLKSVVKINKPIVVSTGGLRLDQIDKLVNFLETQGANFALMHCVSIYPTPDNKLQLNQIGELRARYRNVAVGWSTHESPENLSAIQISYALGARLFERHVGIDTDKYQLNSYSSTPAQIKSWITSWKDAIKQMGADERPPVCLEEANTLKDLRRGVFAKEAIAAGAVIDLTTTYLAIPYVEGKLKASNLYSKLIANRDYEKDEPIDSILIAGDDGNAALIYDIMLQVRGLLNKARVYINEDAQIEISHHYGLRRFREFGAVLITCVNRDYAKKILVQLPRQKHPYHHHVKKEETFQLLSGDIEIVKDGHKYHLYPGDTLLIAPGEWHKFSTLEGCVVEEISSTSYSDDSRYEDELIAALPRENRKTRVDHWAKYFRAQVKAKA